MRLLVWLPSTKEVISLLERGRYLSSRQICQLALWREHVTFGASLSPNFTLVFKSLTLGCAERHAPPDVKTGLRNSPVENVWSFAPESYGVFLISSGTQKTTDCPLPSFLILMHAVRMSAIDHHRGCANSPWTILSLVKLGPRVTAAR